MRRTSPYFALKFVVEVQWPSNPFFETIAGFNDQGVAEKYAADCADAHKPIDGKHWVYRVRERTGKGWQQVADFSRLH